jgi:hypothetical protein
MKASDHTWRGDKKYECTQHLDEMQAWSAAIKQRHCGTRAMMENGIYIIQAN